jgi:hypothetical protein
MSLQERSNLILDFAKVLFANGQATDQTISATERVGRGLGLRVRIFPRWGEIDLQTEDADSELTSQIWHRSDRRRYGSCDLNDAGG